MHKTQSGRNGDMSRLLLQVAPQLQGVCFLLSLAFARGPSPPFSRPSFFGHFYSLRVLYEPKDYKRKAVFSLGPEAAVPILYPSRPAVGPSRPLLKKPW